MSSERHSLSFPHHSYRATVAVAIVFLCGGGAAFAQGGGQAASTPPIQLPLSQPQQVGVNVQQSAPAPSGGSSRVQLQVQGSYSGSVESAESVPETLELGLMEAVQRGLKTNLGLISSSYSVQQARAQVGEARSVLLPHLSASLSENASKVNLAAEGFSAEAFGAGGGFNFPKTVGPFHYYDLHGALQQSLLDVTAIRNLKTQDRAADAAILQSRQAREEVVLAVTGVYLQLLADLALVERQRAEVAYSEGTYKQAKAQAEAGNKAPIDANRSLVEFQTEQQSLRSQIGEARKRQIQLARLIGLPLRTQITPREHLGPLNTEMPLIDSVIGLAWNQRLDLKATETQLHSAEEARKAAAAQSLPSVSVSGTYGVQGTNPNQGNGVFQAALSLNVPIYQGGRIRADVSQADAVVSERRAELANQRSSVEADVRNAYVDLQVSNDQVALADSNRQLATETLKQSQDRFAVGVADSVEVLSSQQSLAAADHDYVNSLFAQHVAKLTLAHAMGDAEQQLPTLFERKNP